MIQPLQARMELIRRMWSENQVSQPVWSIRSPAAGPSWKRYRRGSTGSKKGYNTHCHDGAKGSFAALRIAMQNASSGRYTNH